MEETVAAPGRDQRLLPAGLVPARFERLVPVALVLLIAVPFTLADAANLDIPYLAWDSRAYYDALRSPDPYAGAAVGVIGSYLYPPPFLQVFGPLAALPWPAFNFVWLTMLSTVTVVMLRRVPHGYRVLLPFLVFLAGADIWAGNINLLLAYGSVVGLTMSGAWAGLALTKITPAVGALWLAFRGAWRPFAVAVGVSAGAALVSYLAAPQLWQDWMRIIVGENPAGAYAASIPIPLVVRLPLAVLVLWWAARSDRPWAVPAACFLALPVIWFNGLSMLLGAAALLPPEGERGPATAAGVRTAAA